MSYVTPERMRLADDVVASRFTITKFKSGYDLDGVDDFLDTVTAQLREETPAEVILNTIASASFRVVKWRDGYETEQVDRFLAGLVLSLQRPQDPEPEFSI